MTFADKGSHKKNFQPKYLDTSNFGLLEKPKKKLNRFHYFNPSLKHAKFKNEKFMFFSYFQK